MMQGAASGAVSPTYGNPQDYLGEKAKQVGISTGLGGVTSGILNRLGAALSPKVDEAVNYLRERGVNPTVGQNLGSGAATFEDALSSVNPAIAAGQRRAVQQFNVAAYNEALAPLAEATGQDIKYAGPAGRKGVKAVGDLLSDGYKKVISKISLPLDENIMGDIGKIADDAAVTTKDVSEKLQRFIIKDVIERADDNGVLTGKAFKDAESALTKRAADYAKSSIGDDRTLASHLFDAADVLLADAGLHHNGAPLAEDPRCQLLVGARQLEEGGPILERQPLVIADLLVHVANGNLPGALHEEPRRHQDRRGHHIHCQPRHLAF